MDSLEERVKKKKMSLEEFLAETEDNSETIGGSARKTLRDLMDRTTEAYSANASDDTIGPAIATAADEVKDMIPDPTKDSKFASAALGGLPAKAKLVSAVDQLGLKQLKYHAENLMNHMKKRNEFVPEIDLKSVSSMRSALKKSWYDVDKAVPHKPEAFLKSSKSPDLKYTTKGYKDGRPVYDIEAK